MMRAYQWSLHCAFLIAGFYPCSHQARYDLSIEIILLYGANFSDEPHDLIST